MTPEALTLVQAIAASTAAVATVALVGITAWYAKRTHDIARQNETLVEATARMAATNAELAHATDRMAAATDTLARLGSENLYLEGAPILTARRQPPRGPDARRTVVTWKNVGRSEARDYQFGYEADILGRTKTFWSASEVRHNLAEGQLEVVHDFDEGDFAEETAIISFLARYQDKFGNVFISKYTPGRRLDVRRETTGSMTPLTTP